MKVKTSITLSPNLLKMIERLPKQHKNRSEFFEAAAWAYLARLRRQKRAKKDIEIINRRADYLNEEVMDALKYQVLL
jgi:metal-responsive CopG/Arc/MetJ family transcriptional regulator